jgi:hypothetical protein
MNRRTCSCLFVQGKKRRQLSVHADIGALIMISDQLTLLCFNTIQTNRHKNRLSSEMASKNWTRNADKTFEDNTRIHKHTFPIS